MGVFLENNEIEIVNRVMMVVNNIINENPDIKYWVCPKCRGTGLSSIQGETFWDGQFCSECKGYSKRIEKSGSYSKSTDCEGRGKIKGSYSFCPKCKGYGHLDWLENITGLRNKP